MTELTLTYAVRGYYADSLETLAAPVDNVLGGQLGRLERYVENGSLQDPQRRWHVTQRGVVEGRRFPSQTFAFDPTEISG